MENSFTLSENVSYDFKVQLNEDDLILRLKSTSSTGWTDEFELRLNNGSIPRELAMELDNIKDLFLTLSENINLKINPFSGEIELTVRKVHLNRFIKNKFVFSLNRIGVDKDFDDEKLQEFEEQKKTIERLKKEL